jgi:hypothetical protein
VIIGGVRSGFGDWPGYVLAGQDAGSTKLLQPPPGIIPFLYLPAFAWLFVPAAAMPIAFGYALNGALMAACASASALVCAAVYRVRRAPALMLAFAWNPVTYSIAIGQTSDAGLLLAMLSTLGLTRGNFLLTALPAALLLYKPTYALPLFALMVIRRRLRALVIASTLGSLLYFPSVWATGGDNMWPIRWAHVLRAWFPLDDARTAAKSISTTMVLVHAHVPILLIGFVIALVSAVAVPFLARIPIEEAAALAITLGLVFSVHALTYEAVMVLPLLFVAVTRLHDPWRTRCVTSVYIAAALAPYADMIGVNTLAFIVPALGFGWIVVDYAISRGKRMPPI